MLFVYSKTEEEILRELHEQLPSMVDEVDFSEFFFLEIYLFVKHEDQYKTTENMAAVKYLLSCVDYNCCGGCLTGIFWRKLISLEVENFNKIMGELLAGNPM